MTLPNGIDGIADVVGQLFGTTGPLTPVAGAATWGVNPISSMNMLTQDAVTDLLKENVIRTSPGWMSASNNLYAGLTPGIPYTLAVIEQFVSQATGLPLGTWDTTNEALLALEGIATNKDLQQNWTTIFTDLGIPNAGALATYISNLSTDISEAGVGNWAALLADLGLSGVPDLATFLDNSYTYGNTANSNFNALLTGLAQGNAGALATYIAAAQSNATAAQNNWNTLLTNLSQASAAAFSSWVATAQSNAATSVTNFANLLSGMGLGSIASLVTSLSGTASTASSASTTANTTNTWWTDLMSALGLSGSGSKGTAVGGAISTASSTASSASTAAGTANTNISSLLSGMGLGSIASLVTSLLGTSSTASTANTTATTTNTWWTDLMTALGLGGGGSKGTAVGGAISSAATTASSASTAAGTANTNISSLLSGMGLGSISALVTSLLGTNTTASNASTNVNSTWSWLFGTTTPTSSNQVIATKVANVLGGSSLAADVSSVNGVATTANSGQTTANNNISSLLTGMGLGSIASLVSSLLGTSSTASSASTTASTANTTANTGNTWWSQLMSQLGVSSGTAVGTTVSAASSAASTASTNASTAVANAAAAATTASTAQSTAQDTIDAGVQALGGGLGGGSNAPAALGALLGAQPSSTILPTPNPSASGVPAHGASGSWTPTAGSIATYQVNAIGSHTKAAADNYCVMAALYITSSTNSSDPAPYLTRSASYGSSSPASLTGPLEIGHIFQSGVYYYAYLEYFGLGSVPPGAQTLELQVGNIPGWTFGIEEVIVLSDTYSGVSSLGVFNTKTAASGAPTQSITSNTNSVVAQAFGVLSTSSVSLSAYTKTSRGNSGSVTATSGVYAALLAGDAAGAATTTFGATETTSGSSAYSAVAINLTGNGPLPIGSGFRAYRTGTSLLGVSTGTFTVGNFFTTQDSNVTTSDYSYVASTGVLTVANAGWYSVRLSMLTSSYTSFLLGTALFKNGVVVEYGAYKNPVSNEILADTYLVYCNANDTLQAGYQAATSYSSAFTGESSGLKKPVDGLSAEPKPTVGPL